MFDIYLQCDACDVPYDLSLGRIEGHTASRKITCMELNFVNVIVCHFLLG